MPAVNRRLRRLAGHLPSAAPSAAGGWDGPKSGTAPTAPVTVETTVGWPDYLPPPEYVHVPRFSLDTVRGQGEAMAYLQEEGYVVVKDILTQDECDEALELMWKEIEQDGDISRADPGTWGGNKFGNNWGHSDFLWHIRGKPRVAKAWHLWYRTEDLLVSFDGASLYLPWGLNPEWNTPAMGLHTDQRNHEGIEDGYLQGLVNLIPTSANSGGNVIIPKSHHHAEELKELRPLMKDGQSFYEVVAEHRPDVFESVIHAHVEAGDVVSQRYFLDLPRLPVSLTWKASPFQFLWLDTAIHCRAGGVGVGPTDPDLIRAAVYVTMSPKSRATPETLRQRELATLNNRKCSVLS